MRVFSATIAGETHQFNKVLATQANAVSILRGEEIRRFHKGTTSSSSAIFDAGEKYGWDIVYPMEAWLGAHTGPAERSFFNDLVTEVLDGLRQALPVHGVLLWLHGSLLAEHIADTEGHLLEKIRGIVGGSVPVAVSLDPHANVTRRMTDNANIVTAFRTTPHVDAYETMMRAAELLNRTLKGEITPSTVLARLPMLDALDRARTSDPKGPMRTLLDVADAIEADDSGILLISLHAGFAWADFYEAGPSVAVVHDKQQAEAYRVATYFIGEVWRTKEHRSIELSSVPDAMQSAKTVGAGDKPLIVVEYTDNPSGGGYGDCTNLLRAMLDADLENAVFFSITDKDAVQAAIVAGLGNEIELSLGGKMDQRFSGTPLQLRGAVTAISDGVFTHKGPFLTGTEGNLGPSVVLTVGGVDIVITSIANNTEDREQLRIFGINPEEKRIIGCKSMNTFRADFGPISSGIIWVDAAGICSLDYRRFPYKNLPRPIWPIDDFSLSD